MRPKWDEYFIKIAEIVALRSTCDRAHVGAVITKNKVILSTGYNGSSRGLPHCDDIGHEIVDGHCVRTVHAEANAVIQAARNGVAIDGSILYLTISPCYDCFKMIVNAGIREVVYKQFYSGRYGLSKSVLVLAKKSGVKIREFK
ncbi:MAG: deaminase [Candidatus Yanofskybacteria bacterium CG10_big_fil_rev_8_21_14_0_10_37_15]|uniref:Deaminase n=1 Tax=Candidatus Yanofskybacteria bacterium CG10_big_fil_rev_8_21_14_0_10_37_15 TaxID=1975097 RepID=A0A2H0R8K2_9BACT|nr:MAG: deaminase [Candidatus Yanofskybacteria bacterium CG10_big_fil_rev_8_21_14_0_10_37_15]